jgi:hypothetical protein
VPTWLLLIIDHCSSNAHCAAAAQLGHSISSNIAASIAAFALATSFICYFKDKGSFTFKKKWPVCESQFAVVSNFLFTTNQNLKDLHYV